VTLDNVLDLIPRQPSDTYPSQPANLAARLNVRKLRWREVGMTNSARQARCSRKSDWQLTPDGGYADYILRRSKAGPRRSSVEAAPLMCAGITTFSALRNSGARLAKW
jgi:hypothetical protein